MPANKLTKKPPWKLSEMWLPRGAMPEAEVGDLVLVASPARGQIYRVREMTAIVLVCTPASRFDRAWRWFRSIAARFWRWHGRGP